MAGPRASLVAPAVARGGRQPAGGKALLLLLVLGCFVRAQALRYDTEGAKPQKPQRPHKPHKPHKSHQPARKAQPKSKWAKQKHAPGWTDDWVSGVADRYLQVEDPICVREVPSSGGRCKFISQRLCGGTGSKPLSSLTGDHQKCMKMTETCALVGSSHHLLNATWGRMIDGHDRVIRINAAPDGRQNGNYSEHVGTRTDVRFVNMYGHGAIDAEQEGLCIFLHEPLVVDCGKFCWRNPGTCNVTCTDPGAPGICAKNCALDRLTCQGTNMDQPLDPGKNAVFMDNLHGGITDKMLPHATAGFKALVFALRTCRHVTVLGFGPSCKGGVGSRYYSSDIGVFGWHHYNDELDILTKLSKSPPGKVGAALARAGPWVRAERLKLMLPSCVRDEEESRFSNLFQQPSLNDGVNLFRKAAPQDMDAAQGEDGSRAERLTVQVVRSD